MQVEQKAGDFLLFLDDEVAQRALYHGSAYREAILTEIEKTD